MPGRIARRRHPPADDGTVGTCEAGSCHAGSVTTCTPHPEVCNGIDDDCDGVIDNGLNCDVCSGQADGTACTTIASDGSARTGHCYSGVCLSGCSPTAEVCNGLDDDCDGHVDEGLNCGPQRT
jgi:hypothetical protein